MRYCFDIDDTISRHRNRDYQNAEPIEDVIEIMRTIKKEDEDAHIIIHTARGMNSCNGDVKLAEEKNRKQIEEWMRKHDVPYDEIIFGKPLADVYVDDKAMKPETLTQYKVRRFKGFSGKKVFQVGDIVIKECEDAQAQADRMNAIRKYARMPEVYSVTLNRLYMEYIEKENIYNVMKSQKADRHKHMTELIALLCVWGHITLDGENDIQQYTKVIRERGEVIGYNAEEICRELECSNILKRVTPCHGDFTLSNVLDGRILIDPSSTYGLNTYLADAGKLRASLTGLNAIIEDDCETDLSELLHHFDECFDEEELEVIKLLEKTHYIRVAYSAYKQGRYEKVEQLKKHL